MNVTDLAGADQLVWQKASASAGNGQCVEFAPLPDGGVAVRDSKDASGTVLVFRKSDLDEFLDGIKKSEFDGMTPLG